MQTPTPIGSEVPVLSSSRVVGVRSNEHAFVCKADPKLTHLVSGSGMGALRDQTALNIRERAGGRKQKSSRNVLA